ncbi:hypothetical protein BCR34DRAFT_487047 [Clohesyomyces aquaticus]|uniref:Guanine nucleotide exchange factor Vps9 n=1 Tax=Clohesyomyces aquaticus TaxID=1231657 RepID=A0A1Y1ZH59_9PLEO|nr:hypothetical protein BCR34DRAFT_487047 [Clohesyomyces aquaticus]
MSSPTQAPQPNEAPTSPREDKLANGVDKLRVGAEGRPELETFKDAQSESTSSRGPSTDAGQATLEPHAEAGLGDMNKSKQVQDVGHKGGGEGPANSLDVPRVDQSHSEASQSTAAPPLPQISSGTEAIAPSSTPPPEPSSKSAGKAAVRSPSPPPPPPKDDKYLSSGNDAPSRTTSPVSQSRSSGRNSEDAEAAEYASKYEAAEDVVDDERSEIQSIMEQFEHGSGGPGADEIMSPRLEFAGPMLDSPMQHPPRRSSLEPLNKPLPTPEESGPSGQALQSPPPRTSSLYRVGTNSSLNDKAPMSPSAHAPQYKPTPPVPDPEPDLPFDFHRFLEQLRHRTADPVAKFLRSFLLEFGKKQWMVHEQVKIIGDFLEFIGKKMAQCEVWRTVSDAEFDNAREGMEKLVMNRLYTQTFSPAILPPEPVAHGKGRRRANDPIGPGRRGQHQEDVERDEVLAQKVRIYGWVKEEHLDIKTVGDKGRKFLHLAQQELLKIKSYRAPRDKVICVLNCCKVIFGFLRTSQSDQSADAFVPLLIYTVLQANPDHLVSNVQYILRFRNQDKLGGEAGYYISSLMGAIQFIEGLDRTSLTVSDEEFEKNVEAAVSAIAERHTDPSPTTPTAESSQASSLRLQTNPPVTPGHRRMPSPHLHLSEKSSLSRPEVTPRNSLEAEKAGPRRSTSLRNRGAVGNEEQPEEENAAVAGLLRTIQRPLSTIGRIFSDNDTSSHPGSTPRRSSEHARAQSQGWMQTQTQQPVNEKGDPQQQEQQRYRERLSAGDAAARQASAEAEEARRIQRQEHRVVVETLAGMFPALDREVIDDVVRLKEGRVGLAVDACLALSNP